ncbi:unnamed protein product [Leptidea sinapis]|uniref:Uncharacterized protein n=1 Tax=Leptidea sinapis TaxID=189913 RepID=A0A5E4R0E1_9NEOP|nr:unnamed protein product [Leptidea sinapis]
MCTGGSSWLWSRLGMELRTGVRPGALVGAAQQFHLGTAAAVVHHALHSRLQHLYLAVVVAGVHLRRQRHALGFGDHLAALLLRRYFQ